LTSHESQPKSAASKPQHDAGYDKLTAAHKYSHAVPRFFLQIMKSTAELLACQSLEKKCFLSARLQHQVKNVRKMVFFDC
jgi:hypothetical protein